MNNQTRIITNYNQCYHYGKNQLARTGFLRICYAKICQLGKNVFSLTFETGSYFLKFMKKILYSWTNKRRHYKRFADFI